MPNKKNKRKKKSSTKKTANSGEQTEDARARATEGTRDEFATALKWSQSSGRASAKQLAKKLPATARQLREGAIDPEELAAHLAAAELRQSGLRDVKLRPRDAHGRTHPKLEADSHEALCMAIVNTVPLNDDDSYEFYKDFHAAVQTKNEAVQAEIRTNKTKITPSTAGELVTDILHCAFQEVGHKWEVKILRKTQIKLEDASPLYNVDKETFATRAFELLRTNFNLDEPETAHGIRSVIHRATQSEETFQRVQMAARGIINNEDQIKCICWECNRSASELGLQRLMCCTRCHLASYCSKECQLSAWKSGHNKACAILGERFAQLKENRRRIKQAINDEQVVTEPIVANTGEQPKTCYLRPVPAWDYTLASAISTYTWPKNSIPSGAKGPSMGIFYRNLAMLANGGALALFRNETPVCTKDFIGFRTFDPHELFEKRNFVPIEDSELMAMIPMFMYLIFDLEDVGDEGIDAFIKFVKSQLPSGKLMSITRMVEIYGLQSHVPEIQMIGAEHKHSSDLQSFQLLKELFHKEC